MFLSLTSVESTYVDLENSQMIFLRVFLDYLVKFVNYFIMYMRKYVVKYVVKFKNNY